MSVTGDLPREVQSAMFLRDGWPYCVVCKVQLKSGHVGIGVYRNRAGNCSPATMDEMALLDALSNVAEELPDYTALHEHVANMAAQAKPASNPAAYQEEPDVDLQAQLGQKAHD